MIDGRKCEQFALSLALFVALSVVCPESVLGATHVIRPDGSGDFPTIQAAVDAAASGDVLALASGTFSGPGNRDVDLLGKTLVIRSQSGDPSSCVIDCSAESGTHRAFQVTSGEGPGTALEGLTIAHARESSGPIIWGGGAILCFNDSSLRISYCIFEDNQVVGVENMTGGGAVASSGGCEVLGCVFIGNVAAHGGALSGFFGSIRGCTFINNAGLEGCGAVYLGGVQGSVVESCTFVGNTSQTGAVMQTSNADVTLRNCIFAFNQCGGVIAQYGAGIVTLECCDLYGNEGGDWGGASGAIGYQLGSAGNITADPLFCDAAGGDYSLEPDSPCALDHNPECGVIGAWPMPCSGVPVTRTTWGALKALFGE